VRQILALDPDRAIGAHRKTATNRLLGVLVPDRDYDDLALTGAIPDLESLLGREAVPLVEGEVEEVRVDIPLVVGEFDLVAEGRHLLDADDDLHASSPTPCGRT
jgi:hypothetical protein